MQFSACSGCKPRHLLSSLGSYGKIGTNGIFVFLPLPRSSGMVLHTGLLREGDEELDFGTFLKLVRTNTRVKQGTIAALLADKGWTPTTYTRLENGQIAPRFDDLLPLYRAFGLAGVSFSLADRQRFVERARKKIEGKKTHREQRSDAEWAQLRYELARLDGLPE